MNDQNLKIPFVFSKYGDNWHYIFKKELNEDIIKEFYLVILSDELHPEKYEKFSEICCELYLQKRDPSNLLKYYLKALGTGKVKNPTTGTSFVNKDFTEFFGSSKELSVFSAEDLLQIWVALLLKKKIIVFSENNTDLMKVLPQFPRFLSDFKTASQQVRTLFSFDSEYQLKELETLTHYIIGTSSSNISENYYDLYINLDEKTTRISNYSEKDFEECPVHNKILNIISEKKEEPLEMFNLINEENRVIVGKLFKLYEHNENELTIEDIKELNMSEDVESFYINVAIAEGLVTIE